MDYYPHVMLLDELPIEIQNMMILADSGLGHLYRCVGYAQVHPTGHGCSRCCMMMHVCAHCPIVTDIILFPLDRYYNNRATGDNSPSEMN